jgi:putative flippase GtrA
MCWANRNSIFRYFVVGVVAVALHIAILALLVEAINLNATLATSIGFVVASVFNYSLQYSWTFSATGSHLMRFPRYCFVTSITVLINAGVFWTLNDALGVAYIIAQLVTTGVIFLLNYEANRRFTFA